MLNNYYNHFLSLLNNYLLIHLVKMLHKKLYGSDVTRKNKLLDKQKKGKKRMRQFGKIDIPQNAFLNALKMSSK